MENLHKKYNKEYPFPPVSLSVFKRARPEHILLLQDTKHNMCLCERHENFRLLMADVPTVRKFSVNEWPLTTSEEEARAALEEHLGDISVVRYERWEKGNVDHHGKGQNSTQNRLQLLNKSLPREGFITMFVQVCLFVCGISLTSGQLVSELFPDCTRSCFSQIFLRHRGGDRIYEMRCLFVAVGLNARFIVLPHGDNIGHMLTHPVTLY